VKVLVVDDNEVVSLLLASLLQQEGHEAVQAYERAHELRNPASDLWDDTEAIVCDIRMPGISGMEILAVAKLYFPHIHRIVLTAYEDPEALEVLYDLADVVNIKPQNILDVIDYVNKRSGGRSD